MSTTADELRSGGFTRFWAAQSLSQVGQRFGLVAVPVVAIETLHAGATEVGYLSASLTVCYLLIGLPAGAWVDRWPKRRTMMRSAVVRAAALLAIGVLWACDVLELPWLYAACVIVGVASVFFDVAYQSYLPFIVSEDAIEAANVRLETSAQVAATGGPAVAGVLLRFLSAPLVLIVDALAYVASAGLLMTLSDSEPRPEPRRKDSPRLVHEVAVGIRFVAGNPVLRRLCVSVGVSNFFATIIMTLTPLLILRELHLGPTVMGVVLGVGTLGGVLGALVQPKLRNRLRIGAVMAAGLVLAASSTAAFPASALLRSTGPVLPAALLTLGQFGMTAGAVMFNVSQVSVRQRVTPKTLLARMTASIRFIVWGSMPVAALLAGWLASAVGVQECMWIGVVGTCLTVLPIVGMDRLIQQQAPTPPTRLQNV